MLKTTYWKVGAQSRLQRKSKADTINSFPVGSKVRSDAEQGYEDMTTFLELSKIYTDHISASNNEFMKGSKND